MGEAVKVLKYPGSKQRIANWIISQFPKHHTYLEPYFGSGAILFNKPISAIETVNDLDWDVYNLFNCIREDAQKLASIIAMTPYARDAYEDTYKIQIDDLMGKICPYHKAQQFLIKCWQGHGFRTNNYKVGWKNDVQGRENMYAVYNWYRLPEWIIGIVDRLKQVQIENRPAVELIKRHNYSNVFIYCDPPYLLDTRASKQYKHEMSEQDHVELLELLLQHKGPVMISGYESDLYNEILKEWHKNHIQSNAEHCNGGNRTETIWMNYDLEPEQMRIEGV